MALSLACSGSCTFMWLVLPPFVSAPPCHTQLCLIRKVDAGRGSSDVVLARSSWGSGPAAIDQRKSTRWCDQAGALQLNHLGGKEPEKKKNDIPEPPDTTHTHLGTYDFDLTPHSLSLSPPPPPPSSSLFAASSPCSPLLPIPLRFVRVSPPPLVDREPEEIDVDGPARVVGVN